MLQLFRGNICLPSVQLFGLNANLYQEKKDGPTNFQFLIDSLKSNNEQSQSKTIQINSIIIRRGHIAYNAHFMPKKQNLCLHHLSLSNISSHIILNELTADSLNINLKNLSFTEQSGLKVLSLSTKIIANSKTGKLKDFSLTLPHSTLIINELRTDYLQKNNTINLASLTYKGNIKDAKLTPSDFCFLFPSIKKYKTPLSLSAYFHGTTQALFLSKIHLLSEKEFNFQASASITKYTNRLKWNLNIQHFDIYKKGITKYLATINKQVPIQQLQHIQLTATAKGYNTDIVTNGVLKSNLGNIKFYFSNQDKKIKGKIETTNFNIAKLLNYQDLGQISATINIQDKNTNNKYTTLSINATLPQVDYKGYTYHNIHIDGDATLNAKQQLSYFSGIAAIDDTYGKLQLCGQLSLQPSMYQAQLQATAKDIHLAHLNITHQWPQRTVSFYANTHIAGKSLKDAIGQISIKDFQMADQNINYQLSNLTLTAGYNQHNEHYLTLNGDMGNALVVGNFDYTSLLQHIANTIVDKLPSLQYLSSIKKKQVKDINVRLSADINNTNWANYFLDIPLTLHQPLQLNGTINSKKNILNIDVIAPDFTYNDKKYRHTNAHITTTQANSLQIMAQVNTVNEHDKEWTWAIQSNAANNHLFTTLSFDNHAQHSFRGTLNTETKFFKDKEGYAAAHINIHPSEILIQDSIWSVEPSDIIYRKKHLTVDYFSMHHNQQHIIIEGNATKRATDSLTIDMKDIDTKYVLNLLDFDAVQFEGKLTGKAYVSQLFATPKGYANITANNFKLQTGNLGTLQANVAWNEQLKQIDIQAVANDTDNKQTNIKGYVSPIKNYINLDIDAKNTRLQLLQGFCDSFMQNVDAFGNGKLRLYGNLDKLNLIGKMVVSGKIGIIPIHTTYTLKQDTITFNHKEIVFNNNTIYDKYQNTATINGVVAHNHLKDFTCNLQIKANKLLAYQKHQFDNDTFYGTAYITGNCNIESKNGELNIDVEATPQKGSILVYNAATQGALDNQNFITWTAHNDTVHNNTPHTMQHTQQTLTANTLLPELSSNIHLNLLLNCTPNVTLKLIMDQQTGDYILLNGYGGIRANYYNKGAFEMYGNYIVEHGIYRLTIQNLIKKEFTFQQGGTINFGGNPNDAALNLSALHTVNGVSLADLNIGNSFTRNHIRVNCLMHIMGTANYPKIDFNLDMPTVNNDAKQMIYSLINSEEEMNQQVLYLLAVGRFYSQHTNNAEINNPTQPSKTTLAMQSLLSGTLSQQLNSILNSVINNNNWNFGANISPGTEGFNNAEYEGILSGRLLDNRLRINGQFGYRDNPNTTTSFIGDFDIKYLLYPNGNLAINVYNQTNDRYFTRNSLTTQGVGIIIKKDFTNLRDLFTIRRQKIKKLKTK